MFKINKKKQVFVSAFVALAVVLPAVTFAVGNLAKTNNSYALPSEADMKAAAIASGFGSSDNIVQLWQCVVKAKYSNPTDTNYTTSMSSSELASITTLNCPYSSGTKITDINGIRQLTGLKTMNLSGHAFPSINLSYFTNVETVDLSNNTAMHTLSGATKLKKLTSINLSNDSALYNGKAGEVVSDGWLRLNDDTALTTVNLSGATKLEYLDFQNTSLTSLDLSSQTSLKTILANEGNISSVTLPNTSTLEAVGLAENNLPSSISLPNSCGIKYLNLRNNSRLSRITNLNKCSNLLSLAIQDNNFSSIDVSSNTKLIALKATNNNFPSSYAIDITNNKSLANIQLNSDDYVKATDVTPTAVSGGYKYDFSAYSFIYTSVVEFRSHSGLTSSGEVVTVSNYSATDGWVPVSQAPDPYGSPCGLDGDTTISDDYGCNNSEYTRFKNHYRVLLAEPEQQNAYMIEYDYNGGTLNGTTGPTTEYCRFTGSLGETCTTTISSIRPTRSGYTFLGWSASRTATTASYTAGNSFSTNTDKTFYAVWKEDAQQNAYMIEYDYNGGTLNGTTGPTTEYCRFTGSLGETCTTTISSIRPTRSGYTFLGWSASRTATTASYTAGDPFSTNTDKTLYAVWKEDSPTPTTKVLTYDANGGTNAPNAESCSSTGACDITITSNQPTRDGYTFLGWATISSATTPNTNYAAGKVVPISTNTTLYAVWQPNSDENTYVMAFDANKGTGAPSNVTCKGVTSCSATIPNTKPARNGYTFKGWGTSADATEAKYQPGESVTIAANTTLYAVWEANASGVVTPDTGAPTAGNANGLAIIATAMPIIALGVFVGIKLNRGRKSHIKFD